MKKKDVTIYALLTVTVLLLLFIAFNWNGLRDKTYLQESLIADQEVATLINDLRTRKIDPDDGERVPVSKEQLRLEKINLVEWKGRNKYKRSRRKHPSHYSQRPFKVTSTTSFTFGINEVQALIKDIKDYDPDTSRIYGIRVQLYESMKYDGKEINLIDAYILPVDKNGDPVVTLSKENLLAQETGSVLNASNPCPDYCD